MPRSSVAPRPSAPLRIPWYPDDLLPELQATLATLAGLEVWFENEQARIAASACPDFVRRELMAELVERHRQEREPLVERITCLHQRMMTVMTLQDICLTA